jgi:chorismate synthase
LPQRNSPHRAAQTAGSGEPVFDKLDAKLFFALKTIGAVKAIGIGQGKNVEKMLGSTFIILEF